jgi:hypothetical protein
MYKTNMNTSKDREKNFETYENGAITCQNVRDITKAVIIRKFIALHIYLIKKLKFQISTLSLNLK